MGQVCVRQWRILSEGGFVDEVGSASVVADIVCGRIASGFECGGVVVEMLHEAVEILGILDFKAAFSSACASRNFLLFGPMMTGTPYTAASGTL